MGATKSLHRGIAGILARLLSSALVVLLAITACGVEPTPTAVTRGSSPSPTPAVGDLPLTAASAGGDDANTGAFVSEGVPLGLLADESGTLTATAAITATSALGIPELQRAATLDQSSFMQAAAMDATAQKLGPPKWVKLGTRVTFYIGGASNDGKGSSSSGEGLSQIDVLGVEGTDVVLLRTTIATNKADQHYSTVLQSGGKVAGDAVDSAWLHPTALDALAKSKPEGFEIGQGEIEVQGQTYNVISFVHDEDGTYQSYSYDTETGLLVSSVSRIEKGTSWQSNIVQLLGKRDRKVPGLGKANPAWVARANKLTYTGTWTFVNPYDIGGPYGTPPYTVPLDHEVTLGKGGATWATFSTKTVTHMTPEQKATGSGITGGAGLYWIDPAALAAMKRGQVLDTDEFSEEKVTVEQAGTGGATAAGKIVVISDEMPGTRSLATYDRTTGALVAIETTSPVTGITIKLDLKNKPR